VQEVHCTRADALSVEVQIEAAPECFTGLESHGAAQAAPEVRAIQSTPLESPSDAGDTAPWSGERPPFVARPSNFN